MIKSVKAFDATVDNPYSRLAAELSVEVNLSDVISSDSVIEYVRTGKLPLSSSVVLTPYLAPLDDQFPSDSDADISSYASRSLYDVGDRNILIVAFACDINGSDWSGERYTFTPILFHTLGHAAADVLSVGLPIRLDFTEESDDYGYRKWKKGSLWISAAAIRIVGAARYVKILCYQENHMWPWTGTDWDYGSPYAYFPNVKTGRLYIGAI